MVLSDSHSGLLVQSVQKNKENNLPNLFEKPGLGPGWSGESHWRLSLGSTSF